MAPDVADLVTPAGGAALLGLSRTTINSAIDRGELAAYSTACGSVRLILLSDLKRWASQTRKPGPKPTRSQSAP